MTVLGLQTQILPSTTVFLVSCFEVSSTLRSLFELDVNLEHDKCKIADHYQHTQIDMHTVTQNIEIPHLYFAFYSKIPVTP